MPPQSLGLHNLSYDCMHEILAYLGLPTIKNLRLANRALRNSCTGGRFEACLSRQTTDLSESSLRSLLELSLHRELGQAVKELKICVPIYDPSALKRSISKFSHQKEKRDELKRELGWLQDQQKKQEELSQSFIFHHLASAFASLGHLEKVSLDVEFVRGLDFPKTNPRHQSRSYPGEVTPRASQLYRLLLSAIIESRVSLMSLDLFMGSSQCGVPLKDLAINTWHPEAENWSFLKDSTKEFGIKISTWVHSSETSEKSRGGRVKGSWVGALASEASQEETLRGLLDLLGCLSAIETFKFCLFSTSKEQRIPKGEVFEAIVRHVNLPLLRRCELGGIRTSQTDLLQLLKSHPHIRTLTMDRVALTSGNWRPIFDHFSKNIPALTRLRLSLLSTNHHWENLVPIWNDGKQERVSSCEFDGYDIARGLEFHPPLQDPRCQLSIREFLQSGLMYGHD